MSDFPVDSTENGDMAAVMENFQKKNAGMASRPQVTSTSAAQVSGAMSHYQNTFSNVLLTN
jgi:hypothetical protein